MQNKLNWDDPLPNNLLKEWINLLEKLRTLNKSVTPKAILNGIKENEVLGLEMHRFCDSSLKTYLSMVYLKVLTKESVLFVCYLKIQRWLHIRLWPFHGWKNWVVICRVNFLIQWKELLQWFDGWYGIFLDWFRNLSLVDQICW